MADLLIVASVLLLTLVLFVWNRWRHDLVALGALLILCVAGVVPADEAFLSFGHPAVVTVAAVLILSRALQNSGVVDRIAAGMAVLGMRPTFQIAGLTVLVTFCSAFMNNVGALAILMPVGVHMARSAGHPPSMLLMPLAFGSLLGGLVTLIGTPPNIIIATFRADSVESHFACSTSRRWAQVSPPSASCSLSRAAGGSFPAARVTRRRSTT